MNTKARRLLAFYALVGTGQLVVPSALVRQREEGRSLTLLAPPWPNETRAVVDGMKNNDALWCS